MFSIQEIINITQAEVISLAQAQVEIVHLLIDSRKVNFPPTSLFFAIQGERHDGHVFIEELMAKGVCNFIIEKNIAIEEKHFSKAMNILKVENTIDALQKIAAAHRQKFQYPVIGITGSNGKTIVKEWLAQLLAPNFNIVKSPKSFNSQVGVPLSVWQMNLHHTLGIFEAGISKPNEMEKLQKVIQPTMGIFTNIGTAHEEGFESQNQKIQEKLRLFDACPVIYSLHGQFLGENSYPIQQNFKLLYTKQSAGKLSSTIDFEFENQKFQLTLPFIDDASFENALTCLCVLLHFKIPIPEIQQRFYQLKPIQMRLELKHGMQDSYLIDDSYNNDFAGLEIALQFMMMQKQKNKRIVILSDLLEIQTQDELKIYKSIASLMQNLAIDSFIGIGEKMFFFQDLFYIPSQFFSSTEDFLKTVPRQSFSQSLILVKGARIFAFEKIIQQLQQKTHGTVLEINLNALVHNLNFYRSLLQPKVKIMVMVKAFAYGSGSAEVANLLQYHNVDYLAVAYPDEGVFLRQNGIHLPIMVLNPHPSTFAQLLEYDLEPELYSFKILEEFLLFCANEGIENIKIHLKIDTGMRRLGFEASEMDKLIQVLGQFHFLEKKSNKKVASIFSHLSSADEEKHNAFSLQQIQLFQACFEKLEKALGYHTLKHVLNSPGIVRFDSAQFDMVRLGIGLYGIEANRLAQEKLEPIATFKTTISQIKYIQEGETVGYGRSFLAKKPMKIATIAIGYADGFRRKLSNGIGKVLIQGVLCPVVGRVCMDMTMIDITDTYAAEGDEVIIFGKELKIQAYAQCLDTIPYEVLTNIGERVKRVYYAE